MFGGVYTVGLMYRMLIVLHILKGADIWGFYI